MLVGLREAFLMRFSFFFKKIILHSVRGYDIDERFSSVLLNCYFVGLIAPVDIRLSFRFMRSPCTLGGVFSGGLGFWSWDSNFWGFVVSQNEEKVRYIS